MVGFMSVFWTCVPMDTLDLRLMLFLCVKSTFKELPMKFSTSSHLLGMLFIVFALGVSAQQVPTGFQLVWGDEFDQDGAVDAEKWHHQTQFPRGTSWHNGEKQAYTDRIDNSYVADGYLHIVAIREDYTSEGVTKAYTSARLNSKFAFTYGRVEVRAKLAMGLGVWPAIWTLGQDITEKGGYWEPTHGTAGWPAIGEIDIMEHWGDNPQVIQAALHTPSSKGNTVNVKAITGEDVGNTFHVYSMEWTPDQIDFFYDDKVFYTYRPEEKNKDTWPFDSPQYLLLNVAMGGTHRVIDPDFTQSELVIDYVRVYQKEE